MVDVEPIGTYPAEMFSFAYLISLVGSFCNAVLKRKDKRKLWRNHYIPLLVGKSHFSVPIHDAPPSLANIVIAVVVLIYAIRKRPASRQNDNRQYQEYKGFFLVHHYTFYSIPDDPILDMIARIFFKTKVESGMALYARLANS